MTLNNVDLNLEIYRQFHGMYAKIDYKIVKIVNVE